MKRVVDFRSGDDRAGAADHAAFGAGLTRRGFAFGASAVAAAVAATRPAAAQSDTDADSPLPQQPGNGTGPIDPITPLGWSVKQPWTNPALLAKIAACLPFKKFLLTIAYNYLSDLKPPSVDNTAWVLHDTKAFELKPGTKPAYFAGPAKLQAIVSFASSFYYDYVTLSGTGSNYWIDFANVYLGGGVFTNGFAQEEVMFSETPELAAAAALGTLQTRHPPGNGVQQGSPTPILFPSVHRALSIGPTLHEPSNGDFIPTLPGYLGKIVAPPIFNAVAIAAPKLAKPASGRIDLAVIEDVFNSAVAGFQLAKYAAAQLDKQAYVTIQTGRLGAGVFNNNIYCVYVLQKFAAQHLGIQRIGFWGYTKPEADTAESLWKSISAKLPANPTVNQLLAAAQTISWPA